MKMKAKPSKAPKSVRVRVPVRQKTTLTLESWQRTEALVQAGKELLQNPTLKLVIAMLHNDSPAHRALPDFGVLPTDRANMQSRIEGYVLCLNSLEAIGDYIKTEGPEIEPDYGAGEIMDEPVPDMTDQET